MNADQTHVETEEPVLVDHEAMNVFALQVFSVKIVRNLLPVLHPALAFRQSPHLLLNT